MFQSLKVLKNPDYMPYIIFIAAPSAEALMVMFEDGRRKGKGRGIAGPGTIDFKTVSSLGKLFLLCVSLIYEYIKKINANHVSFSS